MLLELSKEEILDILDAIQYYEPSVTVELGFSLIKIRIRLKQALRESNETSQKDVKTNKEK